MSGLYTSKYRRQTMNPTLDENQSLYQSTVSRSQRSTNKFKSTMSKKSEKQAEKPMKKLDNE